jgi:hypothetical protein
MSTAVKMAILIRELLDSELVNRSPPAFRAGAFCGRNGC